MQRLTIPCLALLALPTLVPAQGGGGTLSPLGFGNRTQTSFTSRGSNATANAGNPTFVFLRIDKESYAGWGVDPANPGMREIAGMTGVLQDQIGSTPETYDLVIHTEDLTNPNYPDITTTLGTVANLPTPPSGAAGAAVVPFNVSFGTPVLAPAVGDVFIGVGMPQPASGVWPADGLSCHALYYVQQLNSGGEDLPGASHPVGQPEEGNGSWYVAPPAVNLGVVYTTTPRQWKIEPLVHGAAGVAGAITNQTGAPQSNTAPGTSSMASGRHPDAQNPPLNAGRMDDVASRWFMTGAPNNTPVFFLASFQPFGPDIPLSAFLAGSSGTVCIDTTAMSPLGLAFTNNGEAFLPLTFSPAARSIMAGIGLVHQSVALIGNVGHANGCTRQIL